jgi:subtilase family serine protease
MLALALLTLAAGSLPPPVLGDALPDAAPVHLGIALRLRGQVELDALLAAQQNPRSPSFRQWLTPTEFGERFGLPQAEYDQIVAALAARGFTVTRYPNRLFVEAQGTSAAARRLFGVQLRAAQDRVSRFRTFEGGLQIPTELAADLLGVAGLDTRIRHRHHTPTDIGIGTQTTAALGPDDLRLEYDMTPLVTGGKAAAGLTTVVLGTQEGTTAGTDAYNCPAPNGPWIPPSTDAIQAYFTLANVTATYNPIQLPNTDDDYDYCGSNGEYQLDVEMQSVGAANAKDIDFVASPASEVFMTGAQYVVNTLSAAVVVSTSLGNCESEETENGGGPTTAGSEAAVMRQAVQQGSAEGQTWFAAAGDTGADDCYDQNSGTDNGFQGGNATVDFPGSMPEVVDMGGSMFSDCPNMVSCGQDCTTPLCDGFDDAGVLTVFEPETTWNEGQEGGAGGGGQSLFYAKPSWQVGIGPEKSDGARDVPDLALESSTETPGTAIYDCGSGQDLTCAGNTTGSGTLDLNGGTSLASPLGAGIFALIAGSKGCPLGDIHAALYKLGAASSPGLNDITSGNNSYVDPDGGLIVGFDAGVGYDLATGWGSVDVAKLAAAWPSCPVSSGGGGSSSSSSSGGAGVSGPAPHQTTTGGSPPASGCSCGSAGGIDFAVFGALLGLAMAALRRRGS